MKLSKLKTRVLSLIMSAVMLVGMVPDLGLAALAADDPDSSVTAEAVSEDEAAGEGTEEAAPAEDAISEDAEAENTEDAVEEAAPEETAEPSEEGEEEVPEEQDIAASVSYNIWVSGVQVTDQNKDNIPAVKTGKVSYDPVKKILDFDNVTEFDKSKLPYSDSALIRIVDEDVTLTGDAVFEMTAKNQFAFSIYSNDKMSHTATFKANLKICGDADGAWGIAGDSYYTITFDEADIDINLTGKETDGMIFGNYNIKSGNINVSVDDVCIEFNDSFTMSGGVVDLLSNGAPETYEFVKESDELEYSALAPAYNNGKGKNAKINITGGSLIAEGEQWGIVNYGTIDINGGAVTTIARGKGSTVGSAKENVNGRDGKFCGIYSPNGPVIIQKGSLEAQGTKCGVWVKDGEIQLGDNMEVELPGKLEKKVSNDMNTNPWPKADGMVIFGTDYKDHYKAIVGPKSGVKRYGITIGNKEVTETNKDKIHLDEGYAIYDPSAHVLTFYDAKVTTYTTEADFSHYVAVGTNAGDVTIKGKLTIPEVKSEDADGIRIAKNATIDADITIGSCKGKAGISAGNITINGGSINVSCDKKTDGQVAIEAIGIWDSGKSEYVGGKLTVNGGYVKAAGKQAIRANQKLDVSAMYVTQPDNYSIKDDTIYNSTTNKPAADVELKYNTPYKLWVGDTQVMETNLDKIPVKIGKAEFDPKTNTLKLTDVQNIEKKYTDTDINKTAYIYSEREEGLIIEGSADLSGADYAVYAAEGDITLSGDFKYTANDNAVLAAKGSVNINSGKSEFKTTKEEGITAYKNVSINSAELKIDSAAAGIMALDGDIKLNNSTVSVNAAFGAGIAAGNELSITGGSVWAAGKTRAVSGAKVVFGKDTGVVYPEGAAISADETTVNGKDGKPAQTVMIGEVVTVEYDVYVGGVQVTSQNAGNVLGDGKVRYDADTATLTFDDAVVSATTTEKYIVSTTKDLIIKGKATLANEEASIAVFAGGKLTIDADLNLKAKMAGILSLGELDITGGSVSAEAVDTDSFGIMAADAVVSGGKVTAKAKIVGIYVNSLTVNGGSIEAYADTVAVAATADGTITIDSKLEIIEPAGGKTGNATIDGTNIKAIVDADGNAAKSVKIDYKGSIVKYTVSFNMMGHGAQVMSQTVVSGNKANKPADPVADDWMFVGWYTEEEYTNEFNFDTVITKDIELFAKWGQILPPGPVIKKSPLDPVEVIDDSIKALYLVKGQKFTVPAGWTVEGKDNKKLVSISKKGLLKAKKEGEAEIKNGDRVLKLYISKPAFSGKSKSYKMEAGQSYAIPLVVNENLEVLWYSAAPDVAVVSPTGNVTAIAKGSAKITAYINGSAYNYTIKVTESTTAKTRTLHLTEGAKKTISIKGLKKAEWVSMDSEIVKVDEKNKRKITAVKSGATILKATVSEEEIYLIHVTVDNITLTGEGLAAAKGANKYDLTIKAGESTTLDFAEIYQNVVFKSSKPETAFIDEDGNVYARKAGKAKFTAKVNGKTITVNVKVQ